MTSKLTSRIVCTHNPHKGDFEFGGVSVKGGCGKVKWNTVRQGDIWINGLFPEEDSLTQYCNYNPISLQTSPGVNEHSEVDWLSKELAYQELICNEKSNYWLDVNPDKSDLVKEEHDVDIISTLTAVAALLRDWCGLEADLSQSVVDEHFERSSSLENHCHDGWVRINDEKCDQNEMEGAQNAVPMQSDVLKMSHYDVAWDDFIQQRLKSQQSVYHAFFNPGRATKEVESGNRLSSDFADVQEELFGSQKYVDIDWCSEERAWEESYSFMHFQRPNRKTAEGYSACMENQCQEAGHALVNKERNITAQPCVEIGLQNQYAHHQGCQHPVASRYSFGRENYSLVRPDIGDTSSVALTSSELPENYRVFGEGLNLAEADKSGSAVDNEVGDAPPLQISDEKKCRACAIQEDLAFMHGEFYDFNINNEIEIDKNAVELMHEAMPFVFPYMCLPGLLTMEKACKSFRDWIRNDVLLWQQLHVEPPLSKNLTNDVLLELASRSKGQLRGLNLVDCTKVTEAAVEQVVLSNPRLTKLSLPGCSRISADAVLKMVEALACQGQPGFSGLKQLRVRNIYGLTREHLAKLRNMVGARTSYQRKPQYYHNGHHASICDDERPIDVEECPKCSNVRLVYDCTREKCQQKKGLKFQDCRACFLCTVRCEECGRCINDNDFEETFSLDLLCSCCWLRLPKCAACSRPGCGRHVDHFTRTPDRTFFCGDCSGTPPDARGPEFHVHA